MEAMDVSYMLVDCFLQIPLRLSLRWRMV